jgi:hypothetical protein
MLNLEYSFAIRIHLFIAILVLLLCAIAARTGEPIVIKDSEAIMYVGKGSRCVAGLCL